jgi:hypothetical protein
MNTAQTLEILRRCINALGYQPSALLFIRDGLDWEFDSADAFGIPVFHSTDIRCLMWGRSASDCPFIPLVCAGDVQSYRERRAFYEAWDDALQLNAPDQRGA